MVVLTPLQARVLGVLVEKQAAVPDTYPLSLNALVAGCNQKTARDPVMNVTDPEALGALDELKHQSLTFEVSGSRVLRYEHNLGRVLAVPSQSVAILAVLMLRGPQTAAELRSNCERLHRFADISSVQGFLDELAAKAPPLVRQLPRAAGERETRWVHTLCGDLVVAPELTVAAAAGDLADDLAELKRQHVALAAEVAELRQWVKQRIG